MNKRYWFKAKHKHVSTKNNRLDGRWIEGYLSAEDYIYSPKLKGEFFIDKNTVCQSIGYEDINGKFVFEKDIVKSKVYDVIGVILYENSQYVIEWQGCAISTNLPYWFECGKIEVIGNINNNKLEQDNTWLMNRFTNVK